jgi:hypothetical protein
MAQFHDIFCVSDDPLTTVEIADWLSEAWYADDEPTFVPQPDDQSAWHRFEVSVPGVGRPVVFLYDADPAEMNRHVAEAIEETSGRLGSEVVNRLQSTRQVIGIELAPDLFTNDAWEMLDIVQSLIATKLDGILITHDGVYDAKLRLSQPIPPLG